MSSGLKFETKTQTVCALMEDKESSGTRIGASPGAGTFTALLALTAELKPVFDPVTLTLIPVLASAVTSV